MVLHALGEPNYARSELSRTQFLEACRLRRLEEEYQAQKAGKEQDNGKRRDSLHRFEEHDG